MEAVSERYLTNAADSRQVVELVLEVAVAFHPAVLVDRFREYTL
jgi:hypothetical protein